jgi:hypothetical protein
VTYEEAKEHRDFLEAEYSRTSRALRELSGGGPMNLTPDYVRATPAWKAVKREADAAFAELRAFNADYVRRFRREIARDRHARKVSGSRRQP